MLDILWTSAGLILTAVVVLLADLIKRQGKASVTLTNIALAFTGPLIIASTFPWARFMPWAIYDMWTILASATFAWPFIGIVDRYIDNWVEAFHRTSLSQTINTVDPAIAVRQMVVDVADVAQRTFVAPVVNHRQRKRYDSMSLQQLVGKRSSTSF